MATLEDEIKVLKEQNNELAQKVQYWKMTAGERENEKLSLMKEMNELRLKLSRLRNNGGYETRKLDASLQQASEKAISHLVQASAEIARSMEIAKAYVRERQEMNAQSPRWSSLGGTPPAERSEKVHRVPPMMMGGQSIQPVVSLSRTLLNTSNPRTGPRSPNQNRNTTERALPMYMLQDVYIPLTRIDITDVPNNNMDNDAEGNTDDSEEEGMEDVEEGLDESARMSEDDEFPNRKLHALSEEESDLEDSEAPRLSLQIDNPLEGPSWLLDTPPDSRSSNPQSGRGSGVNLEPDSTTEPDHTPHTSTQKADHNVQRESTVGASVRRSCEFSPTVRRRKRVSSPPAGTPRQQHYSPRPPSLKKNSNSGRVLKVMVAKMRLDAAADADGEGEGEGAGDAEGTSSPPKRLCSPRDARLTFDAPSPNGATDSAVIVSETRTHLQTAEIKIEPVPSPRRESYEALRCRVNSQDSRSSHHSRLSQDNFDQHRLTESCQREREDSRVRERLKSERDSVQCSRLGSHDSRDSDSGSGGGGDSISNGRTRRPRKMVTYKEKPLNRKLRR